MVNLFYLDTNPKKCAKYYCDKHVLKILIEICQILSQIHHKEIGDKAPYKYTTNISEGLAPYKWASKSINNYKYCINLAYALLNEYKIRYNKTTHKSEEVINWLSKNIPKNINNKYRTPFLFTNNIKIYNKYFKNTVYASRIAYIDFKCKNDKWSQNRKPKWFDKLKEVIDNKKNILKKKILDNVKNKLPNKYRKDKDISAKRFHSYLRISYDTLFEGKWDIVIKKYANMFDLKKPLLHQLGYPHLIFIHDLTNMLLINKDLLLKLNKKSLKYRNKL